MSKSFQQKVWNTGMTWQTQSIALAMQKPSLMMVQWITLDPLSFWIKIYQLAPHCHFLTKIRGQLCIRIEPFYVLIFFPWFYQKRFTIVFGIRKSQKNVVCPVRKIYRASRISQGSPVPNSSRLHQRQAVRAVKPKQASSTKHPGSTRKGAAARPETALKSQQQPKSRKGKHLIFLIYPFNSSSHYLTVPSKSQWRKVWKSWTFQKNKLEVVLLDLWARSVYLNRINLYSVFQTWMGGHNTSSVLFHHDFQDLWTFCNSLHLVCQHPWLTCKRTRHQHTLCAHRSTSPKKWLCRGPY